VEAAGEPADGDNENTINAEEIDEEDEEESPVYPQWTALEMLTKDNQDQPIRFPSAVFTDPKTGEIFITNSSNSEIVVYGADYFPEYNLGKGRSITRPQGGGIGPDDMLYICQSRTNDKPARITVLDQAYFMKKEISFTDIPGLELFSPKRIMHGKNGKSYIFQSGFQGAVVLDNSDNYSHTLVVTDEAYNRDGEDHSVPLIDGTVDDTGRIYLLSEYLSRIYVYDKNEELLFHFGTKGGSSGKMSRPQALTYDKKRKTIYVLDYMRHTVLAFDLEGKYLYEFGGQGWSPGWFQHPVDIEMGSSSTIIIADFFNHRVQILQEKDTIGSNTGKK